MQDDIRRAIEKSEKTVERLEKAIKLLAADSGDVKKRMGSVEKVLAQLVESQKDTDSALRQMANAQAAMASGVGQAIAQLTLAQSLERRVERLEQALFPPKH